MGGWFVGSGASSLMMMALATLLPVVCLGFTSPPARTLSSFGRFHGFEANKRLFSSGPEGRNSMGGILHYSSRRMSSRGIARVKAQAAPREEQGGGGAGGGLPPWLFPFVIPAIGGALFGYDIGGSSSVVRIIGSGTTALGNLDSITLGYIASGSLFGALIASASLLALGDRDIGRKQELVAGACFYGVGTALQSLGGTLPIVLLGRVLYGLGIGASMHAGPLYIAESAPSSLRGKLVSLKEAAIVVGIIGGYAAGAAFGSGGGWQSVYLAAAPFEVMMLAGSALAIPESPRWLALRGRPDEAALAIQQSQGVTAAEAGVEVRAMQEAAGNSGEQSTLETVGKLFQQEGNRRALTAGLGLVLFQQLSGQPSVLYYANRIFDKAGLGFEAAVGVGVFKALMTLVSVALVESPQWGRRPLLIAGTSGMAISLAALSLIFSGGAENASQEAIIAAVVAFVGCYQIGFGPITWLVLSEVFPLSVRSAAVSLATLTNFGSNLFITLIFDVEREAIGESLLFAQFAIIALAAVAFEVKLVPETRGLSLEQIEEQLMSGGKKD